MVVNGIQASVKNRSYLAENVLLAEGSNTITISASDEVGNTSTKSINVIYQPVTGQHIVLVSGQNQNVQIQSLLANPLMVKLLNAANQPVSNKNVVFRVIQGDGVLAPGTINEGQAELAITDANGIARSTFKLGSRTGNGNHRVRAKAVGFDGEVLFYASADSKPANKLSVNSGNNQRGAINQPIPQPFVVVATDNGSNVIEGVEVEFTVSKGSGIFQDGSTVYRTLTDSDGRATASYTLGPEAGLDFHRVDAKVVGTNYVAGFTASALVPGDPGNTIIKGVVLDNQDKPIPNVTIRVDGTTRQGVADAQGQFTIINVPVGPVHLLADGSTTTRPGEWPTLSYNLVTVAGAENTLPAPIYLLPLNVNNSVLAGQKDVELTVKDMPGFKLSIKAGSVTFPDGSKTGRISVTPVNSSKVPMAPPNGMQPQFIVTIQPTGTKFDPPVALTLPNVDGHLPGAQVEMYSYDHDLEEFLAIGLGTVSKDGSLVESNPGVGVIKAGWICASQPIGSGCASSGNGGCPTCQKAPAGGSCGDGGCENDNTQDPGDCLKCNSGSPEPDPTKVPENTCIECTQTGPKDLADGTQCENDVCKECIGGVCTEKQADTLPSGPPELVNFNLESYKLPIAEMLLPELNIKTEIILKKEKACCSTRDGDKTCKISGFNDKISIETSAASLTLPISKFTNKVCKKFNDFFKKATGAKPGSKNLVNCGAKVFAGVGTLYAVGDARVTKDECLGASVPFDTNWSGSGLFGLEDIGFTAKIFIKFSLPTGESISKTLEATATTSLDAIYTMSSRDIKGDAWTNGMVVTWAGLILYYLYDYTNPVLGLAIPVISPVEITSPDFELIDTFGIDDGSFDYSEPEQLPPLIWPNRLSRVACD